MNMNANPFLQPWDTPFGIPDFSKIENKHYQPAFEQGFIDQLGEIEQITSHPAPPSFENTIEALEASGKLLTRVSAVFDNLTGSDTSAELQALESIINPAVVAHRSTIQTNEALFNRIKTIYEQKSNLDLDRDQVSLLEETYQKFVRAGAALPQHKKVSVNTINEELARLETRFGQNTLNATNDFILVLERPADLAGLPESALVAAASEAESRGLPGKHVFTISRSSVTPFLKFADRRDLREKIYQAYTHCSDNNDSHDNKSIILETIRLRAERARLLGFQSHADYMLDDRMAKTPAAAHELLSALWKPASKKAGEEAADLQACIQREGGNFQLEPWDWWYYTEKIRAERYELDEEAIKPYFKLENVRDGAFKVAGRLYGITFTPRPDVPVYHPEVTAYEVRDADSSLIGLFLVDYYMRPSKRSGAWMSNFREQSGVGDKDRPIVVNVCNFARGAPEALLGFDEVRTLFHEFGHALHGLLSQVKYSSIAGTNVKQDFVELPSQIMEHWALETEVMKQYARHYLTDKPIPDELIHKIHAAETFNQGFETTEYLAASLLDMAWHSAEGEGATDVTEFENRVLAKLELIPQIAPRYRSTYFQHIFSGDHYSAGYYVYIWAAVLDADGYQAFKETNIFDPQTASSFRQHILERGGSEDPMSLYKAFRGREPVIDPLLKERGLN